MIRRIGRVLLPVGIAGAGATGFWWLLEGGPNYGPRIIYLAFSAWVFVVLIALGMLRFSRSRTT